MSCQGVIIWHIFGAHLGNNDHIFKESTVLAAQLFESQFRSHLSHIVYIPWELPFQHIESQITKTFQVIFPALFDPSNPCIADKFIIQISLVFGDENMLSFKISEPSHPLQVDENYIVFIGAHYMSWMHISVQITALMEKLQSFDNRYQDI